MADLGVVLFYCTTLPVVDLCVRVPSPVQYTVWNLFSLVNCVFAAGVFSAHRGLVPPTAILFPVLQIPLKLLQCQLIPEQIASIEARRRVKGWRGLYRSTGGLDDRVTKATAPTLSLPVGAVGK